MIPAPSGLPGSRFLPLHASLLVSPAQPARLVFPRRWEVPSVTYFCRTFSRELGINFKFTAEELETALVRPQNMLLVDVGRCPLCL